LLAQTNAGVESTFGYDGLGSTRLLTNSAGAITDVYSYTAFGETEQSLSTETTTNSYRYAGEQYDVRQGLYYLRARYMDPRAARFMQQDEWLGHDPTPITLNKYVYANSDAVNGIDPSGNMTLTELSTTIRTQSVLVTNSIRGGARQVIRRAVSSTRQVVQSLRAEIRKCTRKPSSCDLDRALMLHGTSWMEYSTEHITMAIGGFGSNYLPAPFYLTRRVPQSRSWLRGTSECSPASRASYRARTHSTGACDEYPFNSTHQGDKSRHPALMSLRLTPLFEASVQGGVVSAFYTLCGIAPAPSLFVSSAAAKKHAFFVFPAPGPSIPMCFNKL
jgi:RHS repeat-associated protein